jgi:glycosyltransferase involved in cell wall biosynthesis
MNQILVSVYITNYNYGRYIRKAIDSVLCQTLQDFELIIIDDGSTDNSKEIIESYADNPKIQIIYQQNKGLNITNNVALKIANGKYIVRLDADDYFERDALEVMSNILNADDELGLVFPDYYLVDEDGNILYEEKRHSFEKDVTLLDMPAHGACTMIRKSFLQSLGGYDEQFKCQDGYDLWVRFTAKYKVTNVNKVLFSYRRHGNNLTTNEDKILNTRMAIKEKFVFNNFKSKTNTIAIIPVRGSKFNVKDIAFTKLNNEYVIDIKIKNALKANAISYIIVSSPDVDIEQHIKQHYSGEKRIIFHKRNEKLARLNTDLIKTVNNIIEQKDIAKIDFKNICILSIEYPFVDYKTIEDAINTMLIFKTDSLISVREETNMFFHHDGSGMKPILGQEKQTKLERDLLYRYAGGVIVVSKTSFLKNQKLISGKVGHIVVHQKASLQLKTKLDITIAQCLINSQ